jgi:hypothetical protein
MTAIAARHPTASLLARLLDDPELPARIQALSHAHFGALVREVGVADAGEIIALATTDQLVAAFDEDLFVNRRPGQRERFDRRRFVTWLEVLLEAGDDAIARRVAELDEGFVAHALSTIVLVFDHEALRERIVDEDEGEAADRALEHALCEEIDGYLLVARDEDGWDAVLALVLALDRRDRGLLVRILDRTAAASVDLVDDLAALTEVLSAAEDVVRPFIPRLPWMDRSSITQGYAGVYSSFLLHAERAAERYGVPAHQILQRVGEAGYVGGQEDMIIDIALQLKQEAELGDLAGMGVR